MKLIDLIRLLQKHFVLLLVTPLLLALIVGFLTRHPSYKFSSETILYTGIASGSSVDMDKSFSFFANNTAFDNLINIIKSRETQQEVAVRLLAQHLMLSKADPKYISRKSFDDLKLITPPYIQNLVAKHQGKRARIKVLADTSQQAAETEKIWILQPSSLDQEDYEQTVKNLMAYMVRDDTNFVYGLLNFANRHYSIDAISSITVARIASSDLVKIHYESDDPGICQQTLAILTGVCIMNYKNIKENRSDAVVKYFQTQVEEASSRLNVAEDKLLKFNEDNNIINYYEQSKAVAVVKEDLDVDYNNKRIRLAGIEASIKSIESKLKFRQQLQLNGTQIIDKRNQLADVNFQIANAELGTGRDSVSSQKLGQLKFRSDALKEDIRKSVNDLAGYGNSTEGLPIGGLLNDWINNVIDYESTKAGLLVLGDRIKEFQKQYAAYAPAGANLKRIEREISVSEQEFLELLHGLNLAKLKMQDAELSSNIKAVDPPYYPLSPIPTKRKLMIIIAALVGLLIVFATILVMEYFDETLHNPKKAEKILGLHPVGIFPKIVHVRDQINFPFIANRLLEMIIQQSAITLNRQQIAKKPHVILFFSTLSNEGKTTLMGNIALKLKKQGEQVLCMNFSRESLRLNEINQPGYPDNPPPVSTSGFIKQGNRFSFLGWLLGFPNKQVDYNSPFLYDPENYLAPDDYFYYPVDKNYFSAGDFSEILQRNHVSMQSVPDYVLIELPPILYYPYPKGLAASAGLSIMVTRSNRIWSAADKGSLETWIKSTSLDPFFLLNGVDLQVVETVFGELPQKRSRLRRIIKKIASFQFVARQQL